MSNVLQSMLEKFDGCDGGDPGTVDSPSIWLFGIEHGRLISEPDETASIFDDGYPVERQLTYTYNRNAFKLLAVIAGYSIDEYRNFAKEKQPFVKNSKGYFKGNLYPYACHNVGEWPAYAVEETGLKSKEEYQKWCRENRLAVIKSWIEEYKPKVFIGVGTSCQQDFLNAVFGRQIPMEMLSFSVNGFTKKVFCAKADGKKLVIVPHLSGGVNGLNSHKSIEQAGEVIAKFIND